MTQQIKVKTVKLSNGAELPLFGLGTYASKNQAEMTNLIRAALDAGYRHIDTAKFYENEKFIGDALQIIFKEGKYKREDLFISTKIFGLKGQSVEEVVKSQLKDLQIDQIDLLYYHMPFWSPADETYQVWNHKPVHQVWGELENVYNKKWAKSLGVSNFNTMAIVDLLTYCKVRPVVNQIELHVFLQQTRFVKFLLAAKIQPVSYSPLAKFTSIIDNKELQAIAKSNNATVPQILLAFLLSQGIVVIPKTEKISRLRENLESVNLKLSDDDIEKLKKLNSNLRVVDANESEESRFFFKGVPLFD